MKLFIAALLVASVASSPNLVSRIASGTDAKDGLIKCYVTLVIEGENTGTKTCGGCLIFPEDRIITSASCVFSASEGKASLVKVFPGIKGTTGTDAKVEVSDIYSAPGYNVMNFFSPNDLGIIQLTQKIKTTDNFAIGVPATEEKADAYVGERLVVCGFGNIDNKKSRPKTLQCTTLRVIPAIECVPPPPPPPPGATPATTAAPAAGATAAPPTAPKGTICAQNIDDKNACGGDQGSPVYSNKTGSLVFVGVVSVYPDSRQNARCLDGHKVTITQLGNFQNFIKDPTKSPDTTAAPPTLP